MNTEDERDAERELAEPAERQHWVEVVVAGVIHRWPDENHAWRSEDGELIVIRLAEPSGPVRVGEPLGRRDPFAGATEVARFRGWTSVVRTRDLEPWRQIGARDKLADAGLIPRDGIRGAGPNDGPGLNWPSR